MNGDTLEVMKAISDFRQEATESIGKLHSEFTGHKASTETRLTSLEEDQRETKKKQWYHSILVLGLSAIHHDLGTWFGWKL